MKVAAAAAAVGAAAGAARAFTDRDGRDDRDEDREPHDAPPDEPDAAEALPDELEPEPEEETEEEPSPAAEHEERDEPDVRAHDEEAEPETEPVTGGTPDATAEIVRRAREQLTALRGYEPESVSELARTPDGWSVTFELVEVARVPDTTDVMASYELVLDGDANLVRYARIRRYSRAQAEHEDGP
jgi:hypothetical protein